MARFFGGLPTERQVTILMREINTARGQSVSYETISALIEVDARSARGRTITAAWRRRLLRERNIQTSCMGGAIHLLSADQAQDAGLRDMHRVGRATGRLARRVDSVPVEELTTQQRRDRHNLLRRETIALKDAMQKSARAIAEPKPVVSIVRMAPRAPNGSSAA